MTVFCGAPTTTTVIAGHYLFTCIILYQLEVVSCIKIYLYKQTIIQWNIACNWLTVFCAAPTTTTVIAGTAKPQPFAAPGTHQFFNNFTKQYKQISHSCSVCE